MKKIRLYLDKDVEQAWLGEMANKGWAFKKFCLGVYTFERCKEGEYIYQIDLLDNWSGDKTKFTEFMEELGIEVVARWYRWVYLRKKAADGEFDMYTDVESKIQQYRRIKNFFTVGLVLEAMCFFLELNLATRTGEFYMWVITALVALVVLAFLRIRWRCQWKIQQLQQVK